MRRREGYSSARCTQRALEYIPTRQVPVNDLITAHIPIERVLDAFSIVKNGEAI